MDRPDRYVMKDSARYVKIVEWSDEDKCFIGSCPELFYGGCHGADPRAVFNELCDIIEENVALYKADGKLLPNAMSGFEFVNAMQGIAAAG